MEQKAAWTRGLFIIHSSFTKDGLHAFGRGKRAVCMDGLDLHEALERRLPLNPGARTEGEARRRDGSGLH